MAYGGLLWGLSCAAALLTQPCCAMLAQGSVHVPANGASLISKFCFTFNSSMPEKAAGSMVGQVEVTVWAPTLPPGRHIDLLLLDDEPHSYPSSSSVWNHSTCVARAAHAKTVRALNHEEVTSAAGQVLRVKVRERLHPRWWYIALSDCSNASLAARFKVHAENSEYGWASEFSADKGFVLFLFVPLAVLYACLAALQLYANSVLAGLAGSDDASSKAAHPFARILLAGIALGLGAATLSVLHWALFAYRGTAHAATHVAAQFLYVSSEFLLISLLLLVSQGKCISYIMVAADGWRMIRLLGPFLISCFLLELWGDYSLSRKFSVDYVYTTPCGWALILVDLVLLGVYVKNLRNTYAMEHDRADAHFYRTWGVAYGIWFLALPVTAVLSQAVLAPYVWYIVSLAVTKTATALVYAALLLGLWPGNTRTYFKLCTSMENVLEDCVTPKSAREPNAAPQDRFGGAGQPTLLGSAEHAGGDAGAPAKRKEVACRLRA